MRQKAYLLVFTGFADWEPALAMCEIRKQNQFDVTTVGFSKEPVTSMGGLTVTPHVSLAEVEPERAGIFVMPGGPMWEEQTHKMLHNLLEQIHGIGVPVAAIGAATLALARSGLFKDACHTSNSKEYLLAKVPEYQDPSLYESELAVSDRNIITASGVGSVEFAHEIIKALAIYNEADTRTWFRLFKHGVTPEVLPPQAVTPEMKKAQPISLEPTGNQQSQAASNAVVSLSQVIDQMDAASDECKAYLNPRTGELITLTDEERTAAEDEDPLEDYPEWQQTAIKKAREIIETDDYLPLPDKFDIHEYAMMEDFCYSIKDSRLSNQLSQQIRGSGAFRRFKDKIHDLGIAEEWYQFRAKALEKIAVAWLEEHQIPFSN